MHRKPSRLLAVGLKWESHTPGKALGKPYAWFVEGQCALGEQTIRDLGTFVLLMEMLYHNKAIMHHYHEEDEGGSPMLSDHSSKEQLITSGGAVSGKTEQSQLHEEIDIRNGSAMHRSRNYFAFIPSRPSVRYPQL